MHFHKQDEAIIMHFICARLYRIIEEQLQRGPWEESKMTGLSTAEDSKTANIVCNRESRQSGAS
jgi:hypothetical protein